MSFSTKSSREALADWVSLQTNVTFKTISLLRTHDSERNTLSCNSMRATIRRFDCTTCCCPSVMQIDRCLCTTGTLRIDESSTTCGFYGEIARGNPQELHVAVVVGAIRRIGDSAAFPPAMLIRPVEVPRARKRWPSSVHDAAACSTWRPAVEIMSKGRSWAMRAVSAGPRMIRKSTLRFAGKIAHKQRPSASWRSRGTAARSTRP